MGNEQFDDLNDYLTPEFTLPVNGKKYSVSPPASLVLRIRNWYTSAESSADDILALIAEIYGADYDPGTPADGESDADATTPTEPTISGRTGSLWAQMEADGVSGEQLMRVGTTTALWFGMSHEMALRFWKQGNIADPKAPTQNPNRKARRAANKKAGSKDRTAGTTPAPEPTE